MELTIRLNTEEENCIRKYASKHNIDLNDLFLSSVLEKIEDEYDLSVYEKAIEEFRKDSKTYTIDEVFKICELA